MKKYRKIILYYSNDEIKRKSKFILYYKLYKKICEKYNIKIIIKKNNKRSQLFNISYYDYNGKLQYVSNKINVIPLIIKKIKNNKFGKIKSIELYTNAHPNSTTKNVGYKNKSVALKTLLLIKNKPKKEQFLIVNTLYQRAKYHKYQTKDMRNAMKVFALWIKKYKKVNKK